MGTLINSGNHSALWAGRFSLSPGEEAVSFETSINVDSRMAYDDIKGSIAHVKMLSKQGIITDDDACNIIEGLNGILRDLQAGVLQIDTKAEDIHSFIEAVLTDRVGDAGRKLHTGRSRNDQIALDERLYLRRVVPILQSEIKGLVTCITNIAKDNTHTLMPGYTHTQRAQPVSLAQHLCAWGFMLKRDEERLCDCLKRIDLCPLGAGALAGSTLPLDRKIVATELGFSGPTENSIDSVADRDYCAEFTSDFCILMTHLSRIAEELVLWSSSEWNFVDLSQEWSTGSSIMPQKKNPDFAELIRGRVGRVLGDFVSLITMQKGLPLAYNRDLQEDKESLFSAYDTALSCVKVCKYMIQTATFNKKRMQEACMTGYANATDLADYLVRKQMPFRKAHAVAAKAVQLAMQKHCLLEELSLEELKLCSELIQNDIFDIIKPLNCMENRNTYGGTSPKETARQVAILSEYALGAKVDE